MFYSVGAQMLKAAVMVEVTHSAGVKKLHRQMILSLHDHGFLNDKTKTISKMFVPLYKLQTIFLSPG